MTYNLYTVTYSFDTPGEYAKNIEKKAYIVVGETAEKAKEKAYKKFVETPLYRNLGLQREGFVRTFVRQMGDKKIKFPTLSLTEDMEQFEIGVQFSADRKSLEFLVQEKV